MCLIGRCLVGSRPKRHISNNLGVAKTPFLLAFGELVRKRRAELDLSQEELAHRAGMHRTNITRVERASRSSTLDTLEKLAEALQIQPRELIPEIKLKSGVLAKSLTSTRKLWHSLWMPRPDPISILLEEYRALYALAEFRMVSLDRRAPLAGTLISVLLGAVTLLPHDGQLVVLLSLPLLLIWLVRTTINHARSFEDLIRRIDQIEVEVNALAGKNLLRFQSNHPSRGRAVGGRTGRETVAATLVLCGVLLVASSWLYRERMVAGLEGLWTYHCYLAAATLSIMHNVKLWFTYRYN
jgi:transcriptional regulator with XRE-family HTH domain